MLLKQHRLGQIKDKYLVVRILAEKGQT